MIKSGCSKALRIGAFILALAFMSAALAFPHEAISASSALTLILTKTNSWTEAGKTRSQFSVSIKNEGSASVPGWIITIPVPEDSSMSASDGWNGNFVIAGSLLTIKPEDYNKQIPAGSSAADIGFILTTAKAVELTGSVTSQPLSNGPATETTSLNNTSATESASSDNGDLPDNGESSNAASAPSQDDWLHTDGNKILDKNGTAVWLTGINWFGYNTGTNVFDGVWSCNMQDALASIADRGFNILRIPISSELVLDWKNGVYPTANFNAASNPELVGLNSLQIFDLAIASCKTNGLKVMLDIHSAKTDSMGHLTNLWYTDSISTQDYYDSLTFLAQRFADDDTVIAYDLKNEPHGKPGEAGAVWNDSMSANNWRNVAEKAGNLVLDANPNALIMIEGIEIYPRDIAANGDFSSTNSADYYFTWWGGNLRGVRDYPIDFGSEERNARIVYSPHDYGPAVYAQPWFQGGFTYESLQSDCWNDNWLYISRENIAPVFIGEWGGYMTEPNLTWMTYLRKLISENHLNHTFWCFNANSGDTGGLVKDDFTTWDEEKYAFVKEVLWQQDGKFVGLDHTIALGQSGNGISLSELSGPVNSAGGTSNSAGSTSNSDESASNSAGSTSNISGSGSNSAVQSNPEKTPPQQTEESGGVSFVSGWTAQDTAIAVGAMIFVLAGSALVAYVTYAGNKRKGEDKK